MEGFDRRKFLKGSTVAAGLAGAMTVVPGALPALAKSGNTARGVSKGLAGASSADGDQDNGVSGNSGTNEPVVAHVRDAKKGEIDVFVGTRHFTLHDRNLASRIVGVAG
jgi:hypothetical protein